MIEVGKTYVSKNKLAGQDIIRYGVKIHIPSEVTVLEDCGALVGLSKIHSYNVVDEQGNKSVIDDEDADTLIEKA